MNWKHRPYWIKGGMFGIVVLLCILLFVSLGTRGHPEGSQGAIMFVVLPLAPLLIIGSPIIPNILPLIMGNSGGVNLVVLFSSLLFFALVGYFVEGALLGYLYGKFKNRKRVV